MRIANLFEDRHPFKPKNWRHARKLAEEYGLILVKTHHRKHGPFLAIPDDLVKQLEQNRRLYDMVQSSGYKTWLLVPKLSDFIEAMPELIESKEAIEKILSSKKERTELTREKFDEWLEKAQELAILATTRLRNLPHLYTPKNKGPVSNKDKGDPRILKRKWNWGFNDKGEGTSQAMGNRSVTEAEEKKNIRTWYTRSRKKDFSFWTSPAIRRNGKWTSPRIEFAKQQNKPNWIHHLGFLYRIKPTARILVVNGAPEADIVTEAYKLYTGEISDHKTILQFPWKLLPLHWDGIYVVSPWEDEFLEKEWSPDSAFWFNSRGIELISKVSIDLNQTKGSNDET